MTNVWSLCEVYNDDAVLIETRQPCHLGIDTFFSELAFRYQHNDERELHGRLVTEDGYGPFRSYVIGQSEWQRSFSGGIGLDRDTVYLSNVIVSTSDNSQWVMVGRGEKEEK